MDYGDNDINFKLFLLEAVDMHNHNVHTSKGYTAVALINICDESIYTQVIENIIKKFQI